MAESQQEYEAASCPSHNDDATTDPAETDTDTDIEAAHLLLAFLRGRDVSCPVCRYNLRDLTRPICPECRQPLTLTVGTARLRLGWLLAALAPGFFSGIAACFLLVVITIAWLYDDPAPLFLLILDGFGLCSGIAALILIALRIRFLALPSTQQRRLAIGIWLVHIAAFIALLSLALSF